MKTIVTLLVETALVTLDRQDAYNGTEPEITYEGVFRSMEEAEAVWDELVNESKKLPEFHEEYYELFDTLGHGGDYRVALLAEFREEEDDGSYDLDV